MECGQGLKILHKSRPTKKGRNAGGGIALVYDSSKMALNELKIAAGRLDIVCGVGKLMGNPRKVAVIGLYIPPRTRAPTENLILQKIQDVILRTKTDFKDPIIIIAGDTNRRCIRPATDEFPEIVVADTTPSRPGAPLDILATNFTNCITETIIHGPLETKDGSKKSDHDIIEIQAKIPMTDHFKWIEKWSRRRTAEGDDQFKRMVEKNNWLDSVANLQTANEKATWFKEEIDRIMNACYPLKRSLSSGTRTTPGLTKTHDAI